VHKTPDTILRFLGRGCPRQLYELQYPLVIKSSLKIKGLANIWGSIVPGPPLRRTAPGNAIVGVSSSKNKLSYLNN